MSAWLIVGFVVGIVGGQALDRTLVLDDGAQLRYGIHLPPDLTDDPVPLVVGLHYSWGGGPRPPAYYGRDYMNLLVRPALAELGAIIIAPDCPGRGWDDPTSVAAVVELIEAVAAEYPIDPDRVVVTGYSLGGMGTWSFVARHPDMVSAAVPVAGRPSAEALDNWGSTPVFAVHSRADEVVAIGPTEQAVARLSARGVDARLHAVDGLSHYRTGQFVVPLRESVAWIRAVWAAREAPIPASVRRSPTRQDSGNVFH